MILLVDNYDSFAFNLQRYLVQLGQTVRVLRNDDTELNQDLTKSCDAIVLSPGPKAPQQAGYCLDIVRRFSGQLPILGVCLGHQVIFEALGGTVGRSQRPTHGKSCVMQLAPSRLFDGMPAQTSFARYHSLVGLAETLPDWLRAIAWSPDGEIMALEHREHLTFGVQFHPESVLSFHGHRLLNNFLGAAGLCRGFDLPACDLRDAAQLDFESESSTNATKCSAVGSSKPPPGQRWSTTTDEHAVVLPQLPESARTSSLPSHRSTK